ncbi:hypothetical protein PVAP13_6KG248606 [Panicum virgatum]|uniref:Uncharacterized protein n=1 Tax=Panicum virgatum TaxID=38727 RepID=A0A8T0RGC6_PANVG|nr:hypothetical protein PVAP13_6KG248606 [Panicum virgatum]
MRWVGKSSSRRLAPAGHVVPPDPAPAVYWFYARGRSGRTREGPGPLWGSEPPAVGAELPLLKDTTGRIHDPVLNSLPYITGGTQRSSPSVAIPPDARSPTRDRDHPTAAARRRHRHRRPAPFARGARGPPRRPPPRRPALLASAPRHPLLRPLACAAAAACRPLRCRPPPRCAAARASSTPSPSAPAEQPPPPEPPSVLPQLVPIGAAAPNRRHLEAARRDASG